ncbi:hypothetical protein R1sor_016177 [Riccia sorocarpa]|uniref:Reverse transcriptase domain-containing protein n=1 Tax=Riccia sorocarpa TaxID=122646 RepID=A0ABD3HE81_9MARC
MRQQNDTKSIKPVLLSDNLAVSCVCLADDTAVYTDMEESLIRNVFNVVDLLGRVNGEKINVNKSRMIIIGKKMEIPPWANSLGVQIVPPEQTTRYMGAQLASLWRGVDNRHHLRTSITNKARAFSSPLLSFESRANALRHAVFAPSIIKAVRNPEETIWGRIFFSLFLGLSPEELPHGLYTKPLRVSFPGCPVATLLATSWFALLEKITWQSDGRTLLPDNCIAEASFLAARRITGPKDASDLTTSFDELRRALGVTTGSHFLSALYFSDSLDVPLNRLEREVILVLCSAVLSQDNFSFQPAEWRLADGSRADLKCSGSRRTRHIFFFTVRDGLPSGPTWNTRLVYGEDSLLSGSHPQLLRRFLAGP